MSRAFLKETDGWNYCRLKQIECSDAAFNGRCEKDKCKYPEEKEEKTTRKTDSSRNSITG